MVDSNRLLDHILNLTTSGDEENTPDNGDEEETSQNGVNPLNNQAQSGRDNLKRRIKKPYPTPEKPSPQPALESQLLNKENSLSEEFAEVWSTGSTISQQFLQDPTSVHPTPVAPPLAQTSWKPFSQDNNLTSVHPTPTPSVVQNPASVHSSRVSDSSEGYNPFPTNPKYPPLDHRTRPSFTPKSKRHLLQPSLQQPKTSLTRPTPSPQLNISGSQGAARPQLYGAKACPSSQPQHKVYCPKPTEPSEYAVREIELMVTFINEHDVTMFWAQIISPETITQSAKLASLLAEHCPQISAVKSAQSHLVFATLWDGEWSRCVTVGAADRNNFIEVFFVDFGNKVTRRVGELVQLPFLFASIPFLAYPFKMQGLVQDRAKEVEAISSICISERLTGVISTPMKNDELTSIVLMRPSKEVLQELPECKSYNDYLREKGYVVKSLSERHIPLLPTAMYIKTLSERCLQGDRKIKQFLKAQKPYDQRSASQRSNTDVSESETITKDVHAHQISRKETVSAETQTITEVKNEPQTPAEITNQTLNSIIQEVQQFALSCSPSSSQIEVVREAYQTLQSTSLPTELITKKNLVDSAELELTKLQEQIKLCEDKAELEGVLVKRDEQINMVNDSMKECLTALESCQAEALLNTVVDIIRKFPDDVSGDVTMYEGPEEALKVLADLETTYNEQRTLARTKSKSSLASTADYFTSLSATIQHYMVVLESGGLSTAALESSANISFELPDLELDRVFTTLKNHQIVVKTEQEALSPVLAALESLISIQAEKQFEEINSFVTIKHSYSAQTERLSNFTQNKPDVTQLTKLKAKVKKSKRALKLALLDINSDSDTESSPETDESLPKIMSELHSLYQEESAFLSDLVDLAQTQYPELLITFPQINNIIAGFSIVKKGWELHELVPPNASTYLSSEKQLVMEGVYCGEVCYVVDYSLRSGGDDLEREAAERVKLEGCFAVFIDSKRLQAYGCTLMKPECGT